MNVAVHFREVFSETVTECMFLDTSLKLSGQGYNDIDLVFKVKSLTPSVWYMRGTMK